MKNSTLAKSVVVFFASFLALTNLSAQSSSGSGWQLYKSDAKVDVYKEVVTCTIGDVQMEYWSLKFVNKTATPVTFSYQAQYINSDGTCATCTNNEYDYTVSIPANGTIVAACGAGNQYDRQAVYVKALNRPNTTLQTYDMANIVVQ